MSVPALAIQPEVEPKTRAALGCMKLGECTEEVYRITDISHLVEHYGDTWADIYEQEIVALIDRLNAAGVEVYLGASRYFLVGQRGIYYTDNNKLFMNESYGLSPRSFIETFRHEAWHAVQDCMAGTINNSYVAIVFDNTLIPNEAKILADVRYQFFAPKAIPWEQEAIWAGDEAYMSADALNACAAGEMWNEYEPTPKTKEWLVDKGFIK